MAIVRTYGRATREALALLGGQIRLARRERRMSEAELAERVGVARSTLQLIERGSPKVEIGLVFEAASLVGVPLLAVDPAQLGARLERVNDKLAILPRAVRPSPAELDDDF